MTSTSTNGPNGSRDNWNAASNWDLGVPTDAINAVIFEGCSGRSELPFAAVNNQEVWEIVLFQAASSAPR